MSTRQRATLAWVAVCGWLAACDALQAAGGERTDPGAGAVKARVFNVLDYGAVADDTTDNTDALTILRNVIVTGYHTGIVVNEHTDGDNINLASNLNGLQFAFAHHASRFGRVGAQRCANAVTVTGKHGFTIEQLDMEIAGKGQTDSHNAWQATTYNLNDPDNLGVADINYWVVEGNVGAVEKFTRNGGASIRARRIGSAPAETKPMVK